MVAQDDEAGKALIAHNFFFFGKVAKDDEERRALIARNVALEESVKALKETKARPTASLFLFFSSFFVKSRRVLNTSYASRFKRMCLRCPYTGPATAAAQQP
jgi:hypothetical protein